MAPDLLWSGLVHLNIKKNMFFFKLLPKVKYCVFLPYLRLALCQSPFLDAIFGRNFCTPCLDVIFGCLFMTQFLESIFKAIFGHHLGIQLLMPFLVAIFGCHFWTPFVSVFIDYFCETNFQYNLQAQFFYTILTQ